MMSKFSLGVFVTALAVAHAFVPGTSSTKNHHLPSFVQKSAAAPQPLQMANLMDSLKPFDKGHKNGKVAPKTMNGKFTPNTRSSINNSKNVPTISEGKVRSFFYLWNDALATGNSRLVARRYSKDAVLLPTVSDDPRTDYEGIKDYFDKFLLNEPQGIILDGIIKVGDNWAKDAGIYEFTMGKDGSRVKARYSFIYIYEDGEWKILHHHSSFMPEQVTMKDAVPKITPDQVRNLFYLWNDALDTLDSRIVTSRYSQNAVLLPTVSDEPRTDHAGINDYFEQFVKLEPQGTVLESHVSVGDNWAKDVGIYEFAMRATGAVVRARYSFIYIYEDGQWKISHHHSSAMPESKIGQDITEEEVKSLFYLWNNALLTLDSDAVAMRYARDAVLLPTVSDSPRTDYRSIKNYFDNFLQKRPQGRILESFATVGENWCKDVGIYEFTMGVDGSVVRARYSFVYVFEDGQWKISHHHSSIMPESVLGNSAPPPQQPRMNGRMGPPQQPGMNGRMGRRM